jgi:predicted nucleotidyltransferase
MPQPQPVELTQERIQRTVSEVAGSDPRILAVYLFGSRIKGEEHARSDVDLAVLFDEPRRLSDLVDLEIRFEDALGTKVDLVDLGKARPFLALDVIRGERLYGRDSKRCDEFDLYVLRRAGDLAPLEKEHRRMLLDPERYRTAAES